MLSDLRYLEDHDLQQSKETLATNDLNLKVL